MPICQCPLAMDKWEFLVVGPNQRVLGLDIDTRTITISIPTEYKDKVLQLIKSIWHIHRHCFTASKVQQLTGKLAHLAQAAPWVSHLLSHLYASIAYVLFIKQTTPPRIVGGVLLNCPETRCFQLSFHGSALIKAYGICNQTSHKNGAPFKASIQHQYQDAYRDQILPVNTQTRC